MPETLNYTVVNAQLVECSVPIEIDGMPANATCMRAVVEAAPADRAGKTLTVVLPPDALEEFAEGSAIVVTIAAAIAADPIPQEA